MSQRNELLYNTDISIPHFSKLNDFNWVDNFVEVEDMKDKIAELKQDINVLNARPITKADILDNIKNSMESAQQKRVQQLAYFINHNIEDPNMVETFLKYQTDRNLFIPEVSDWKDALAGIREQDNCLKSVKKEKALLKLEKQVAELTVDIQAMDSSQFVAAERKTGKLVDMRVVFVDFWQRMQSSCPEQVGIHGTVLSDADQAEQKAYKSLELKHYVNDRGRFKPCPS